ncbi:CGGC domain-containing protein [Phascolarctobacterium succinatutens]|uniref:CGGC domain-containing protein n=1 Tax=Phascolarctobacterium succinatutens TaxID=626940 RepID=UPI0026F0A12D|nr:CGGC domain-containing protein [Phascolarctobacterium succinatutens]
MKKIAILRCLKTSASCAGAGCLRAFYEKDKAFAQYGDEELRLMAMWTCNGCGDSMLENQEGIRKKIERMKALELDALHISHCTHKKDDNGEKHLCPKIKEIIDELQEAGITIVDGTH